VAKHQAFYDGYRWRVKTSPLVKQYNPHCQRLFDNATQCGKSCEAVHHLRDPMVAPQFAYDWRNLVAVCLEHHAGGQQGETQSARYCATCGPLGQIHFHKGGLLPT